MQQSSQSFEGALRASEELLLLLGSAAAGAEPLSSAKELLSTIAGARGFFVSYLTGKSGVAQNPPADLLQVFCSSEIAKELLVKNLVMSSATAVHHRRNKASEQEAASIMVAELAAQTLKRLPCDDWKQIARSMQSSLQDNGGNYTEFLQRWSYDSEQKTAASAAIKQALETA